METKQTTPIHWAWFAVLAIVGVIQQFRPPVEQPEVQHAWVQVGLMVLSIGLSIIAGRMLAKKNTSVLDDQPTTLASRGSYTNWLIGVRLIGFVFCYAGLREMRKEKVEGAGKGGGDPEQDVIYEAGWHVLSTGPLYCLRRIVQAGQTIMSGPITRDSHPSGTVVDLGNEGSFTIYWGDFDQPVNSFLGDQFGVYSRWPGAAYIVWNKKRLGTSATWPQIEYVVEKRPAFSLLTQSPAWSEGNFTISTDPVQAVLDVNSNANQQVGYLEVEGDATQRFLPKGQLEVANMGAFDGTYRILRTETVKFPIGVMTVNGFQQFVLRTRIFLIGGTDGAVAAGDVNHYVNDNDVGANIAHVIAELLFAPAPLGLGKDPNGLEPWDLDSLEALGVEADTDKWRSSVLGTEGETAEALLGNILQDHGIMLPIDTNSGALTFKRVRFPTGTLRNLGADIYSGNLPEVEVVQGENPVDRIMFSFSDNRQNYTEMTITVDDDGQASYEENVRSRKVGIQSTVVFETAAKLAELRSPEELSHGAEFRLDGSRDARDIIPGDAILGDGFDEVLRVISVGINPLSERVKLSVLPDFYGARKTDFISNQGNVPDPPLPPLPDESLIWAEVPEQLLGGFPNTQRVVVAHIRAHNQISFASVWFSPDNTSYTLETTDTFFQTGGTLADSLPADSLPFIEQGPTYSELGPDNSALTQDLSADPANFGAGRQICLIQSSAGTELCYLQRATVVAAGVRRLDGLARARFDTRALEHPAGARVFIFDVDAITSLTDVLLVPQADLYVKTQPGTSGGQVLLSAVVEYGERLSGKGQVPITPDYAFVVAPQLAVPAYATGEDVTVSWALSTGSVGTGAGQQNAGTALAAPTIPGTVLIELLNTADVVQASKTVAATDTQVTFTNAEITAALGAQVTHKYRITHIANGFASNPSPALTVTKL